MKNTNFAKTDEMLSGKKRVKIAACLFLILFAALFSVNAFSPGSAVNGTRQIASGAELFETNCARCHGPDGKGGKGPNLASEKRQTKWRESDEKLVKKIMKGGLFMPAFGKKLEADQIKAIADHVRTLKE